MSTVLDEPASATPSAPAERLRTTRAAVRVSIQWFTVGPGGQMTIPVAVDYGQPFAASDHPGWRQEHLACVEPEASVLAAPWECLPTAQGPGAFLGLEEEDWFDGWPGFRHGPLDLEEVPNGSPF